MPSYKAKRGEALSDSKKSTHDGLLQLAGHLVGDAFQPDGLEYSLGCSITFAVHKFDF